MNILLVSSMPPWPTDRGGNQRTFHLFNALARKGNVDLVLLYPKSSFSEKELEKLTADFNLIGIFDPPKRAAFFPWNLLRIINAKFTERFAHNFGSHKPMYMPNKRIYQDLIEFNKLKKYDLYVGRYLRPIAQSGMIDHQPLIIDVDDFDTQKYESRMPAAKNGLVKLMLRYHMYRLNKVVPRMLSKANFLWVTNSIDKESISKTIKSNIRVLPNIPFQSKDKVYSTTSQGKNILLVCSMQMSFNERATEQFLAEIWPSIRNAEPDATLTLVGSRMSTEQIGRWSKQDGVDPRGTVADLDKFYAQSAFTITPIFDGGGTKIKVSESLMYGRTCVIAEHAHRGYEDILKNNESLLVAKDNVEFAEHCIQLLRLPELRDKMASNGQSLVQQYFSSMSFDMEVAKTIDAIHSTRKNT